MDAQCTNSCLSNSPGRNHFKVRTVASVNAWTKALALLLLLLPAEGSAQKRPGKQGKALQDSLLSELSRSKTDTDQVKLYADLSHSFNVSNSTDALKYAQQALELSRRIGWRKGEGLARNNLGNAYRLRGSYPAALNHYFEALKIFESSAETAQLAKVEGNIGVVYLKQEEYSKALDYFFKSLALARETESKEGELTTAANIGTVYLLTGATDSALYYLKYSLRIAEEIGDRKGIINQMSNIGTAYAEQGQYMAALNWLFKALPIARQEGDLEVIAATEGNIGETFLDLARDTSVDASSRAANIEKAVVYLNNGITVGRQVRFNDAVQHFLLTLSDAYALRGDYYAGLDAYRQYTALKDSTFNLQNNKLIADLETKREMELKDKDIQIARLAVAKKRNERYAYIGGIALLLLILGILFRNYRRQQHLNTLFSHEMSRSDALLRNILPAEVAEELKETGAALARHYDTASVLFTDFVDFTSRAQQLTPSALVEELNVCFTAFDAIIERAGLEKIKTIGDAYMAVSGIPTANREHAPAAISAALDILHFVEERRSKQQGFEIRIGIHSGPVVAGIVGVKKFAYDVWGDTVNTAARMEQHGVPGAINISQAIYELVKEDFPCVYRGRIAAKHKGEVEMYLVATRSKGES